MKQIPLVIFLLAAMQSASGQSEFGLQENETPTYAQTIEIYTSLAQKFKEAKLLEMGSSDAGMPMHVFVMSADGDFDPVSIKKKDKRVVLINNAIHPGEPCGVNASIQLVTELLENNVPQKTVVCIIPFYNIGGGLNRSCCSRVNQDGPEEYGFRGNARNLDLNRDFIKCDSKNARAFAKIFRTWDPDVFVDTHTTNGYDYQYAMGLITTQRDKLHHELSRYLYDEGVPRLFDRMKASGHEITQYVYSAGRTPKDGIKDYMDSPRYSTGYAAQFNCMGFITEAHKFKPFPQRVEYTLRFLEEVLSWMEDDADKIKEARMKANQAAVLQSRYPLVWYPDTVRHDSILFKGYTASYEISNISGLNRLFYDRSKPFERKIPYFNRFNPGQVVIKPKSYIIPQAWSEVIGLLKLNDVAMDRIETDRELEVEVYYIDDLETRTSPYEGHYLHYDVSVRSETQKVKVYAGDYVVKMGQLTDRFVVEVLEPQATDSYFAWNFFDSILQRKEWFSDFAAEETVAATLAGNDNLREELEAKRKSEPDFAASHWRQLDFVIKRSKYYEKTAFRYPIFRLN